MGIDGITLSQEKFLKEFTPSWKVDSKTEAVVSDPMDPPEAKLTALEINRISKRNLVVVQDCETSSADLTKRIVVVEKDQIPHGPVPVAETKPQSNAIFKPQFFFNPVNQSNPPAPVFFNPGTPNFNVSPKNPFPNLLFPANKKQKLYQDNEPLDRAKLNKLRNRRREVSEKVEEKLAQAFKKAQNWALTLTSNPEWDREQVLESPQNIDVFDKIQLANHLPSHLHEAIGNVEIAVTPGRRKSMEDVVLATVLEIENGRQTSVIPIYGIFDGHSGDGIAGYQIAKFLSDLVPSYLKNKLAPILNNSANPKTDIFNLLKTFLQDLGDLAKKDAPEAQGGTTATIALIIGNILWVACAGDSRAIISTEKDSAIALSMDAAPSDPNFAKGVFSRGGEIQNARVPVSLIVEGKEKEILLSTARAIGYCDASAINPRPKILAFPLDQLPKGKNCLVIASDGVWCRGNSYQVSNAIQSAPIQSDTNLAAFLVKKAFTTRKEKYEGKERILQTNLDNIAALILDLSR